MTPFSAIFVPPELRDAVSDRAWLQGMLDAERALATASAAVGLVPTDAAARIAEVCRAELYEPEQLAEEGRAVGNPAEPLVRALREAVGGDAADWVHYGATSQDIVDTAAMRVARGAVSLVLAELDRLATGCTELARAHRSTPMAARTLLQQAVPTTFGLKAAGWLVSVLEARRRLGEIRERLEAQLGGAAGTLAVFGDDEHRYFDDGIAMGKVGFDPEADRPDHPAPVIHHKNPRPGRFKELLEPFSHGLFRGWRVSDRLGQLQCQPLDVCGILGACLAYLDFGLGVHGSPRSVIWSDTYPKSPGVEPERPCWPEALGAARIQISATIGGIMIG